MPWTWQYQVVAFFILEDNGARSYGRAGAFGVDSTGNLVDAVGNQVIGFQPDGSGNITGNIGPLVISRADQAPAVTSTIDIGANLDAGSTILPAFTVGPNGPDPTTFNHSTSLTVYDFFGRRNILVPCIFDAIPQLHGKTFVFVDGVQVDGPDTITFDASGNFVDVNGAGSTATSAAFTPGGVGTPTTFTVDYGQLSQFGSPFGVSSLNQNGFCYRPISEP